jgi:hypothetical protein
MFSLSVLTPGPHPRSSPSVLTLAFLAFAVTRRKWATRAVQPTKPQTPVLRGTGVCGCLVVDSKRSRASTRRDSGSSS